MDIKFSRQISLRYQCPRSSLTWPALKPTVILYGLEHFGRGPFDRLLRHRETDVVKILCAEDAREDGLAGLLDDAAERLTPGPPLPGTPEESRHLGQYMI